MQELLGSTIAKDVTDRLRQDIISGKLSEGQHITIREIVDAYSVSQTPVREAFRTLEGERLLENIPYKGAVVHGVNETFFINVISICDALGAYANECVMKTITAEQLDTLQSINNQILALSDTPEDVSKHRNLNQAFHSSILAWTNNSIAQTLHSYYHAIAMSVRQRYSHSYTRICEVAFEHQQIIDAMREKDIIGLKYATDRHARNARNNFLKDYRQSLADGNHQ